VMIPYTCRESLWLFIQISRVKIGVEVFQIINLSF